ncbi:MAG: PepSY domain-containing protein [Thiolinea sp.]
MNKTILATTIAALLTTGFSTNLLADSNDAETAAAQQNAAITIEQAIATAEQTTGGKSGDAEFELEDGASVYEVEVTLADGSEVEVTIDAQSGAVLSQETEEADDKDDDDEDESDDDEDDKDDD